MGRSCASHLSCVHVKFLPGYSTQASRAEIRTTPTVRHPGTRPPNIPQRKDRTLCTTRSVSHSSYYEQGLRQAKEWRYLEHNSASGARLPHKHPIRPKVTLQPAEVRARTSPHNGLVDCNNRDAHIGIVGLQWPDIDFRRRMIHIRWTFYRGCFGLPKRTQASA